MNQREFQALGASELDPMAVVLYVRTFRRYMNFATGHASLSLSRLQQELEYHPPTCSRRGKVEAYSTKRVRTLINHLVNVGLLVLIRPGNAAKKEAAIYHCVLATTDKDRQKKAPLGQVRPNEEGHIADTVQGHIDGHSKKPMNKGAGANKGHIDGHSLNSDEGHISERSEIKDLSITRATESTDQVTGINLPLTDEFFTLAKLTGLDKTPEQIQGMFETFRYHQKNRNTPRHYSEWLAEWRVWCGREKSYAQTRHTRPGQSNRRENPTARLLRESKESANELARTGYYDTRNEPGEDTER